MKITKARLKQIIQEELQTLSEQAKGTGRRTPGSVERLSRLFDFFHAPKFGDPAKKAAEMADVYNRQSGKKPAAQPEPEPEDLGPGMSVDDQFVASGDTGAQQSMAVSGADVDVAETDPTVTGATQVADILSGRPEGEEGAFGDADGKEKPAKPARVARKGAGATRREINAKWKAGEFGPYEGGKKEQSRMRNGSNFVERLQIRVRRPLEQLWEEPVHQNSSVMLQRSAKERPQSQQLQHQKHQPSTY